MFSKTKYMVMIRAQEKKIRQKTGPFRRWCTLLLINQYKEIIIKLAFKNNNFYPNFENSIHSDATYLYIIINGGRG